ncbi:MAG TPA: hypothetical protein VKP11_05385, partial [Frankiaceae bacterium]|nr:hypothetical protein [Frankiaceae bacterium]
MDATRHPDIALTATLTPAPPAPLPAAAFRVWENGRPRPLRVEALPNDVLRVCLVVDTRAGQPPGDVLAAQRRHRDAGPPADRGAGRHRGDRGPPRVVTPLSADMATVLGGLGSLRPAGEDATARALELAV